MKGSNRFSTEGLWGERGSCYIRSQHLSGAHGLLCVQGPLQIKTNRWPNVCGIDLILGPEGLL